MSPTKAEWQAVWDAIVRIEEWIEVAHARNSRHARADILDDIQTVKDHVQQRDREDDE